MNPQVINTAVKVFNVIENGELTTLAISNYQKLYDENFLRKHKFGQQAMDQGEAPIKMVVVFGAGNIQGMRGDRYQSLIVGMVRGLHKKIQDYYKQGNLLKVQMYDNRGLLPDERKLILQWEKESGTKVNLLPLYLPEVTIKQA